MWIIWKHVLISCIKIFTDKSEVFSFLSQFDIFNFLFIIGSKISNYHKINDIEHDLSNYMETLKFGTPPILSIYL